MILFFDIAFDSFDEFKDQLKPKLHRGSLEQIIPMKCQLQIVINILQQLLTDPDKGSFFTTKTNVYRYTTITVNKTTYTFETKVFIKKWNKFITKIINKFMNMIDTNLYLGCVTAGKDLITITDGLIQFVEYIC